MGKMDVSLTEVLQRADITAASKRLLDVRKFASAMSWITMRERIFFFSQSEGNFSFWKYEILLPGLDS